MLGSACLQLHQLYFCISQLCFFTAIWCSMLITINCVLLKMPTSLLNAYLSLPVSSEYYISFLSFWTVFCGIIWEEITAVHYMMLQFESPIINNIHTCMTKHHSKNVKLNSTGKWRFLYLQAILRLSSLASPPQQDTELVLEPCGQPTLVSTQPSAGWLDFVIAVLTLPS